jgi:hypothetical protein
MKRHLIPREYLGAVDGITHGRRLLANESTVGLSVVFGIALDLSIVPRPRDPDRAADHGHIRLPVGGELAGQRKTRLTDPARAGRRDERGAVAPEELRDRGG